MMKRAYNVRLVRLLAVALTVWGSRPGLAAAQQTDAMARLRAALPPPALASIEAAVATAQKAGMPADPLLDKALEGVAKNVAPDRIVLAVQQRLRLLTRARALLPARPAGDLTAVADAMQRGVPDEAVQAIGKGASPSEPVGVALHTLADLLDRGVPVAAAEDVLSAWQRGGADVDELPQLPAAVERLLRQGVLPDQAAAAVAAAIRGGQGLEHGVGPGGMGPPGQLKKQQGTNRPPVPPGLQEPPGRGKTPPKKGGRGNG